MDGAALAVEEIFRLADQLAVARFIHPSDAGRAAALDLEKQARPGARREHRIRTGAQQKGALQGVEGTGDGAGAGEGAEIDALGGPGAAMFQKLGKGVILAQQDIGKAFVVAVGDIVARLELLDQIGFQQQRFGLRRRGDEEHLGGFRDHAGDAVIVAAAAGHRN